MEHIVNAGADNDGWHTCCQLFSASLRASIASRRIRSTLYHSASATFRPLSARQA